ncbi:MAG: dihydropteroate synthase [Bacteroidales bacterium]
MMNTILRGCSSEVTISTSGPVIIIGECINPTRRKKLVSTLQSGDFSYVAELARIQIENGADVLDVNVGFPGVDDEKLLPETVKFIQDNFDVPLCLDSPNPKAIEAALKVSVGRCLINSVNAEEKSMNVLFPVARDHGAAIIGLVMDEEGITNSPEKRLSIASKLLDRALACGLRDEDLVIDPMAMAVSADPQACLVTLETIRLIHGKLGLNMTMGASNISFGLPGREYLNSAFLTLAIHAGLTCPIANPEKITPSIRATDLVLGRDDFAMRFIDCAMKQVK